LPRGKPGSRIANAGAEPAGARAQPAGRDVPDKLKKPWKIIRT